MAELRRETLLTTRSYLSFFPCPKQTVGPSAVLKKIGDKIINNYFYYYYYYYYFVVVTQPGPLLLLCHFILRSLPVHPAPFSEGKVTARGTWWHLECPWNATNGPQPVEKGGKSCSARGAQGEHPRTPPGCSCRESRGVRKALLPSLPPQTESNPNQGALVQHHLPLVLLENSGSSGG